MRILVIEDKELHRKAAETTLSGHEVTIIKSFDEAMKLMEQEIDKENVQRLLAEAGFLTKPDSNDRERWNAYLETRDEANAKSVIPFPFDVVMTDMMMPMSMRTLAPGIFNSGEQVPYGFIITLKATMCGAKFVAMVTDTNHHQGAMSAAIDHLSEAYYQDGFSPNFVVNGAKVMFVHAPFVGVPGTTCPECKGKKQVEHDCYTCNGSGKKLEWYPLSSSGQITSYSKQRPIEGTICEACRGTRKKTDNCHSCKGDGTDHNGKDWGRVFADLIA